MEVQFTFRQFRGTDELRELITEKLESRLGRCLDGTKADVRVTISLEGTWVQVDFVLSAFGEVFRSSRKTPNNVNPVIDALIDKLERQVLKWKDMARKRRIKRQ